MSKRNPIALKFWLIVVAAFVLLIAAWTALIFIAAKNRPEAVPLEGGPTSAEEAREGH